MTLFIAEKPDLAKAIIAGMDGNFSKNEGYFIKGENIITWGFGHILELFEPEDYNPKYKIWNMSDLPFEISEFKYKPKKDSSKQLKIILGLINDNRTEKIVNCGDADEEGQILIDEILNYSKTKKPTYRILLQDITPNGVRKSLANMKPNSDFKGLSDSGFARSIADYVVGLNLTRAYTLIAQKYGHKGVLSVGRVQTPILGLIVNRDKEHESHKESFYFNIFARTTFSTPNGEISLKMKHKSEDKITDENLAQTIAQNCQNKNAQITKAKHESKSEIAPLPYNLLLLQSDCARLWGYKPDFVLRTTQSLRENHKAITYNRSDCQYLSENQFSEVGDILDNLKENLPTHAQMISQTDKNYKHEAFNDNFVTAHTAIIPTAIRVSGLNEAEQRIYDLIAKRFIAMFLPPCEFIASNVEILVNNETFTASAKKITKQGYKEIYGKSQIENEKGENELEILDLDLRAISENSTAKIDEIEIKKEATKPKPYYTMASLLKDLTSISKYCKDERIKRLLKEKDKDKKGENGGIGTPATRSEHIKKLFDRGFIIEKGKNIISTDLGKELISKAPQILTAPDMTALWYEEQKEIQNGSKSKQEFLNSVLEVVKNEIINLKGVKMEVNNSEHKCPKCGSALIRREAKNKKGHFFWGCANYQNCDIGFINDDNGKPNFEAKKPKEIDQTHKCPKCESGYLQFRKGTSKAGKPYAMWSCSAWRSDGSGCNYTAWDDNGRPKSE